MKSRAFLDKLDITNFTNDEDCGDSLSNCITETLIEAAKAAKIKPAKNNIHPNSNEPWFDNECGDLKKSIKRNCRKLRNTPNDARLKSKIFLENKSLKKLIKEKKAKYKSDILGDMTLNRNNQKLFWKLLDKFQGKKNDYIAKNISSRNWVSHFKQLLQSEEEIHYPPDVTGGAPLDFDITHEELKNASYVLKDNKAIGHDSLSNEMIQCLLEANSDIVLKLFNCILKYNSHIGKWLTSILNPIHKSGDKSDTTNYRGIAVMSCFAKLFYSVLNLRLTDYVLEKKILNERQLGFIKGNRTTDAHIILHSLIQKYCFMKGSRLYSCFVDFSKAFDTIPRGLLFKKLANYGIKGNFFNILKNMYINDSICIKVDNKLTNCFRVNQGVRQGCVLSPLLFNLFLADLPEFLLSPTCQPAKLNDQKPLGCLVWADDLILLSESDEGLQNMLYNLGSYASINKLRINSDKTKSIIFNKTGRLIRSAYKLADTFIHTTNSYKYLGCLVTPAGGILHGLGDLKDRALRAYYKLKTTVD